MWEKVCDGDDDVWRMVCDGVVCVVWLVVDVDCVDVVNVMCMCVREW